MHNIPAGPDVCREPSRRWILWRSAFRRRKTLRSSPATSFSASRIEHLIFLVGRQARMLVKAALQHLQTEPFSPLAADIDPDPSRG
jgi:hypothetical protein